MRRLHPTLTLAPAALTLALAAPAAANFAQQAQVPNGTAFQCIGCHPDADETQFTLFGAQMRDLPTGTGDWPTLCALDADADGATNGAEMGDPDCAFPNGAYDLLRSNPSDPASLPPPEPEPDPEPEPGPDPNADAGLDAGPDRPTGDAVDNLDDGCATASTAPAGLAPILTALLALIPLARLRRRH